MAESKRKGDLGEAMILADILKRGYKVAQPLGEDWPFDWIVLRNGTLEKVQCKYAESKNGVIQVRCRSVNNWSITKYTEEQIDWIAVYDASNNCCYYIPSSELGEGRAFINLRLTPPKNGQCKGIRFASNYLDF